MKGQYVIDVQRVIDVRGSVSLVQMKDKRTTYLHISRVPRKLIEAFRVEKKKESSV
tara:strand:+ start:4978 stop:5145 length:168 start_codon:yes stop_codon:yes gene_type:complete